MSEPRGRGRSRGRARGQVPPGQNAGIGPTLPPVAASPPVAAPPPVQSAWGRKPGPPRRPQQPAQPDSASGPSSSVGRASHARGLQGDTGAVQDVTRAVADISIAERGDTPSLGRGAMRGRRVIQTEALITRPQTLQSKKGITGQPLNLQANYFKVLRATDWCLYQYRVDFSPEEDRTVVRKGLLRHHKETLGAYIFDGTVMFTSNRLQQPLEVFSKRESDEAEIRITIKLVGDLVHGDPHYVQFFNIIMRKCLGHLNLQLVGRNFFDAQAKIDIHEFGLQLWPGYVTSIRQHEQSLLMCAEISHKVMRQETLYDILEQCHQDRNNDFRRAFSAKVIGSVVLTGYNNNTYRIDDVDYEVSPRSTFNHRNGDSISYVDYYRTKYQINIRQPSQPMLVSKVSARERRAGQNELIYLVPELCRSTGLTDDMRSNFQLMRAVATHTRVGPDSRISKLLQFNNRLQSTPGVMTDLREWQLELDRNLVNIPGRRLAPEKICFNASDRRPHNAGEQADWTRDLRNSPTFIPIDLTQWVLVVPSRARRDVDGFVQTLLQCARGMSLNIAQPRIQEIPDDRSTTYTNVLEDIMSKMTPKLIFCVVSNNRADRYSAIKKKCCIDRPVPTQVFLAKNMNAKGVQSIATKVAIQMNCKIGGAPWHVEIPISGLMVIGFDVCHDTTTRGCDYGALVASLDVTFSRYFSAVGAHSTGEELSDQLSINMMKALAKYQKHNGGALPARIIIYRDGVGEGQIPYVYQHEVELLKRKLASAYGATPVRMAFIVVTKRINTRIFCNKQNPPPGTIVDDVITDPDKYDFFIVSQSVRQGTVSPTAYSVIADTVGLDADKIQRITYKLTHMYYNWSGTVRVPAPCQYAHKLAFLVSQAIHRSPDNSLENLLYFL